MSTTTEKTYSTTRRDLRYPQLCDLSMNYEGATEDITVRPPDLSPHGMFVNTDRNLPNGAVLKLTFRLANTGVTIHARAEVRYCLKGVGVGVEFVDISPDSVRAIEKEIRTQVSKK
jgi:hypothetical protein